MNCKHCNSIVPETSKFCPECGGQLKTKEDVLIETLRGQLERMSALELLRLISHKEKLMGEIAECLKNRVDELLNDYQRHPMFQAIVEELQKQIERDIRINDRASISNSSISIAIKRLVESDKISAENKKWLTDFEVTFNTDHKAFMKSIFEYLTEYHGIVFEEFWTKDENLSEQENIVEKLFNRNTEVNRRVITSPSSKEKVNGLKVAIDIADTLDTLSSPFKLVSTILKAID